MICNLLRGQRVEEFEEFSPIKLFRLKVAFVEKLVNHTKWSWSWSHELNQVD
jgi:hypothetical protein